MNEEHLTIVALCSIEFVSLEVTGPSINIFTYQSTFLGFTEREVCSDIIMLTLVKLAFDTKTCNLSS